MVLCVVGKVQPFISFNFLEIIKVVSPKKLDFFGSHSSWRVKGCTRHLGCWELYCINVLRKWLNNPNVTSCERKRKEKWGGWGRITVRAASWDRFGRHRKQCNMAASINSLSFCESKSSSENDTEPLSLDNIQDIPGVTLPKMHRRNVKYGFWVEKRRQQGRKERRHSYA